MNREEAIQAIVDALREYLSSSPISDLGHFQAKDLARPVKCGDGTLLSVQASSYHYCEPKQNRADWSSVEVMFLSDTVTPQHIEIDSYGIGAYVPIEKVAAEIYDRRDRSNELAQD